MKRSGAAPSITSRFPQSSEPDWRSVFESAAVGIAITDLRGRYLASNRAHQKMLGYTAREILDKTFLDVTHEDDRPATLELSAQMARGDLSELRLEKRYRRKDGKVIWVRVTASTIPGPTGAPSMLMGVIEDITDRKRTEDQVRAREASPALGWSDLTPREREIVQLVAEGRSSKEVAALLRISVKTVESHRTNVMRKLRIRSVSQLVRYAVRNGIVQA